MNKLTADEILTWVARNVHKWEDVQQIVGNQREFAYNTASVCGDRICFTGCAVRTIAREPWLARRAELQNKPTYWPKRANWLAQHKDGEWTFYSDSADNPPQNRPDGNWYSDDVAVKCCHSGEVLGDWRDTLEQRPADLSEEAVTAHSILEAAGDHMRDRAATYDKPEGERSMVATVEAFRAITGHKLTEEQGWLFMQLLKAVRSQQGAYRADSYEDGAAYVALAGEAAARERGGAQ